MLFLFSVAILLTSVPKSGVHGTLRITPPPSPPPALSIFLFARIKQGCNLQTRGIVFITGRREGFLFTKE